MVMTFDGYISGPNGELDWMMSPDKDRERNALALIDNVDTALIGRGVYDDMANYWPTASGEFADKYNALPKLVFGDADETLSWSNAKTFVVKDNLAEEVTKLKQLPGKDMVLYGGVRLAQSFVNLGLVDEYQLTVYPVALGEGRPLFHDLKGKINLKLIAVEPYASGAMMVRYQTTLY